MKQRAILINTVIILIDGLFYNDSHHCNVSALEASGPSAACSNAPQISDSNQHTIETGLTSVKLIVPLHVRPAFFFWESNLLLCVAWEQYRFGAMLGVAFLVFVFSLIFARSLLPFLSKIKGICDSRALAKFILFQVCEDGIVYLGKRKIGFIIQAIERF